MDPAEMLLEDISIALQTPGMLSFFDRLERNVIVLHDNPEDDPTEDDKMQRAEIQADPQRFQLIKPMPNWKTYHIRESFIRTVDQEEVAARLNEALKQTKPFSRFRSVLSYFPEWQMKWYYYEEAYFREAAKKWMDFFEV